MGAVTKGRISAYRHLVRPQTWPWKAVLAALAVALAAVACTTGEDVPPLERSAQALNRVIMCPVCPGESIDQSQNDLAVDMRGIVLEKLQQGSTDDQIKAFFVERYGPSVLLEPPRRGFSLTVWVIPPVGVLGAGLALYLILRLMRRSPGQPAGGREAVRLSDAELAYYSRRIEAALDYDGDGLPQAERRDARGAETAEGAE